MYRFVPFPPDKAHITLNFAFSPSKNYFYISLAGNVKFREIIARNLDAYQAAEKRLGKPRIVDSIIREVHANGGRFLKPDRQGWKTLLREEIKDKVSHAIRDARMLGEKRNTTTTPTTPKEQNEIVTAQSNNVAPNNNVSKRTDHPNSWMEKPIDTPSMTWQQTQQYHNNPLPPSSFAALTPTINSNCMLHRLLPIVEGESQLSSTSAAASRLMQPPPSLLVEPTLESVPPPPLHHPTELLIATTNLVDEQVAIPRTVPYAEMQTLLVRYGLSGVESNGGIDHHSTVFREMHPAAAAATKPLPYSSCCESTSLERDNNIQIYPPQNHYYYYRQETDSTLEEEQGDLNCSCGSLDLVDVEQETTTRTTNDLTNTMMMMLESRKSISQWDMEFSMASLDLNSDTTTSAMSKGSSPLPSMPTPPDNNHNHHSSNDDLQLMANSVMLDSCRSMDLLSLDSGDTNHVATKFSTDYTRSFPM